MGTEGLGLQWAGTAADELGVGMHSWKDVIAVVFREVELFRLEKTLQDYKIQLSTWPIKRTIIKLCFVHLSALSAF